MMLELALVVNDNDAFKATPSYKIHVAEIVYVKHVCVP